MTIIETTQETKLGLSEFREAIEAMYEAYRLEEGLKDRPATRLGFLYAVRIMLNKAVVINLDEPGLQTKLGRWIDMESLKCAELIDDEFDLKAIFG